MNQPRPFRLGLLLQFAIPLLLLLAASGGGLLTLLGSVRTQAGEARAINLAGAQRMLSQNLSKLALVVGGGYGTDADRQALNELAASFDRVQQGLLRGDAELGLRPATDPVTVAQLHKVQEQWGAFKVKLETVAGQPVTPAETPAVLAAVIKESASLLDEANRAVTLIEAASYQRNQMVLWLQVGLGVVTLCVLLVFALLIRFRLIKPLLAINHGLGLVTRGDLRAGIHTVRLNNEIGDIVTSFNLMVQTLHELIGQIKVASGEMAGTSRGLAGSAGESADLAGHIRQAAEEVAGGTELQSQSSRQVTETVGQLDQAIGQIAAGAQQTAMEVGQASVAVSDLVRAVAEVDQRAEAIAAASARAAGVAESGAEVVAAGAAGMLRTRDQVLDSSRHIAELEQHSARITAITGAIGELAEQTNLLALNAAIEAARAGEHGRGFAVVAGEVRALAARSAASAREIASLIQSVQEATQRAVRAMQETTVEVEGGSRLASEAGTALREIVSMVAQMATEVGGISDRTRQMRRQADEVARSVEGVAAVTEQNSASAEEMAAGASEVNQQVAAIVTVSDRNSQAAQNVSAAVEQMSAATQQVAAASGTMAAMAGDLQARVSRFTLA